MVLKLKLSLPCRGTGEVTGMEEVREDEPRDANFLTDISLLLVTI